MSLSTVLKQWKIDDDLIAYYGKDKAKLSLELIKDNPDSKLVLVTAINPTPAGEGKTTVNIGLSMALNQLGYRAISALREPSLGPCFGMKGGATGGGKASIHPSDDINLHFTGDFHAITSAHNLLAAMLDNHIYHGNELNIDLDKIIWGRVLDMNDRALRNIEINDKRYQRNSRFDITAASEIMAILTLSESLNDLKGRLAKIIVAYNKEGNPVTAQDLQAVEGMAVLLKDALEPNVVLTTENTPAIVHGGPFANIAHGCNSVLATKMSMSLGDFVVTEAGFGSDLGAEKFMNIKAQQSGLNPDAIVLVATIRSLKYQDGLAVEDLEKENLTALENGFMHLLHHIKHLKKYDLPVIVALNKFQSDTQKEIGLLEKLASEQGIDLETTDVFNQGGKGALGLANMIIEKTKKRHKASFLYDVSDTIEKKINIIAQEVYGADRVSYSQEAKEKLETIDQSLYVCMAKTQYSLSDDKKLRNVPKGFSVHVDDIRVAQGAGFVIVLLGAMMTMPGLAKKPNAINMRINDKKEIIGLK